MKLVPAPRRHFLASSLGLALTLASVAAALSRDASPSAAPATAPDESCAADMALVDGTYCERVEQTCLRWLESAGLPYARCAEYAKPSRCVGPTTALRFCIDRYEYTPPGEALPLAGVSLIRARATCEGFGRRLCTGREWTFACEGEEMRPYPYGWSRQPVCNQDRYDLLERGRLVDHREPASARPNCVSPWGVVNMVGNVDEPVRRDVVAPGSRFNGILKGGWWLPGRNRCRPETSGHDDFYAGPQVGVRCCADATSAR